MRLASESSMESVGLENMKEAFCDFTAAKQLLDHHLKESQLQVNEAYREDFRQLDKIINENLWYYKSVKDFIAKSARLSFQSNIESRFNSLLNGGNPIIEKSKLIENMTPSGSSPLPLQTTPSNIAIPTPVRPTAIPDRPRSISPSPANDPDKKLLDLYSMNTFIDVDTLMDIYHKFDSSVLLIDYRLSSSFKSDHISLFANIINIDPLSVKPQYIIQDVIDHSLLLSTFKEKETFTNIAKYELVIVIDQSSIHAKLAQDLLRFIAILDEKNHDPKYRLKRKPIILDGGFDEWVYFMNNQATRNHTTQQTLTQSPMAMNNITNFQQNYIHTKPFLSRSPSPTGLFTAFPRSHQTSRFGNGPSKQHLSQPKMLMPISSPLTRTRSPSPSPVFRPAVKVASLTSSSPAQLIPNNTPVLQVSSVNTPFRSASPNKSPILVSGLYNLGNSCYMSASLQCMMGTKELTNYLLQDIYLKFVAKDSKLGSRGKLTKEYQSLAKTMLANTFKHAPTNPKNFKKVVGTINSAFDNCYQQDSAEFLHFILDTIHEDLNWSANKESLPAITDEDEANREILPMRLASTIEWERYLKTDYSTIIEIFAGQYASRLECGNCHKTSTTYIPFNMLSVPVPSLKRELNLYDCIDSFVSSEILTGDNAWKCPRCRESLSTKKKLTITRLPAVLIVHLERFSLSSGPNLTFVKNTSRINIPLKMSMKRYWPQVQDEQERQQLKKLPPRGQEGEWEYSLYGIVRHYGTLDGGHYISEVKKNGTWVKFDDDKVKVSDTMGKKGESDGSAYILFYEKIC
ncbi:hypothetical protein PMKS-000363 [Pichia membranifaciens]|uniref:Ubiquitin carboxyl-terminal hydrolase n=1 Tax=Pichia membranifaciens TaxID=4926 RepID=A0A1Q2YBI7_9ASCO|nr:hypothetical protein PMKS-000363 [Pichia membranifaciens]